LNLEPGTVYDLLGVSDRLVAVVYPDADYSFFPA
jgi:hypothetical protein